MLLVHTVSVVGQVGNAEHGKFDHHWTITIASHESQWWPYMAKISVTSTSIMNMPTRESLAGEAKNSFLVTF